MASKPGSLLVGEINMAEELLVCRSF